MLPRPLWVRDHHPFRYRINPLTPSPCAYCMATAPLHQVGFASHGNRGIVGEHRSQCMSLWVYRALECLFWCHA
jgi:hypothetical protein